MEELVKLPQTLILSRSSFIAFNHSSEYSEFIASVNVVGTLVLVGGTGRTAFSNPTVYIR